MDMVWVDTMFPGINEEDGWEKNLERVINYDYLLKEYLDWQLKHLSTDNFDPTDWANVTADLIHMASEYTDNAVEAAASLTLDTAKEYTRAELSAQYGTVSGDIADAVAAVKLYADAIETRIDIGSYYTKSEIGDFTGYQTAVAALQAYADNAVATIDLSAYYSKTDVDGMFTTSEASVKGYADDKIAGLSLQAVNPEGGTAHLALMSGNTELGSGASLGLSVTNNSNGYSYVKLKSGNIDLATSGNITLGGNVVFASGSGTTKGLKYTTISGGTITTNTISALDVTAKTVQASASISSPLIIGGSIFGATFYAAQNNFEDYFHVSSNGWELVTDNNERASLKQGTNILTLSMGDTTPGKIVKYYGVVQDISNSDRNYLWIGGQSYPWNTSTCVGLLLDLSYRNYKLYGTAM